VPRRSGRPLLARIHPEVAPRATTAGGWWLPELLEGARVLDLGLRQRPRRLPARPVVGRPGSVVGDDNDAPQQLEVAEPHREFPRRSASLRKRLVSWREPGNPGRAAPGAGNSFRSGGFNCVVKPSARDKLAVLRGARLLSRGEFYFRRCLRRSARTRRLLRDPVLYGECLSGALYERLQHFGPPCRLPDPRLVSRTGRWRSTDPDLSARTGPLRFFFLTATHRLVRHRRGSKRSLRRPRPGRDLPGRKSPPTPSRLSLRTSTTASRPGPGVPRLRTPSGAGPKAPRCPTSSSSGSFDRPLRPFPGCVAAPPF